MKKVIKGSEPPLLEQYRLANPNDNWKTHFRKECQDGYVQVKEQLIRDQKGLCAYCEIDLKRSGGIGLDDFKVEHFSPENPHRPPPNHALDWQNMLGCCSGGDQKYVIDAMNRFTPPNYSCDVPKKNYNWVGVILNPLTDIPAFPCIFEYTEQGLDTGQMLVDLNLCPADLQSKAKESIAKLQMNAPRLKRFRTAVIDVLRDQLSGYLKTGKTEDEALQELVETYFSINSTEWPAFFTTIRWYLADVADEC